MLFRSYENIFVLFYVTSLALVFNTESCDEVRCEDYQECIISPGGKPTCVCPPCTEEDQNSGPVCSSFGVTYSSMCALNNKACQDRTVETFADVGACVKGMLVLCFIRKEGVILSNNLVLFAHLLLDHDSINETHVNMQ